MDRLTVFISKKRSLLIGLVFALAIAAVFSFRWAGGLPFSGNMPVITDHDTLGFWSRYLIYAKEPLTFPLGTISNLSFPFGSGNISRGSIPLVAFPLKVLSKIFPPLSEFYYFVTVEILSVFLTALFTYLLLHRASVSMGLKVLGMALVSLSFPLLYRSSPFYGVTFEVLYFPLYCGAAFYFTLVHQTKSRLAIALLALFFPAAALTDYYAFYALIVAGVTCASVMLVEYLMIHSPDSAGRLVRVAVASICGVGLAFLALFVMGNMDNLEAPSRWKAFENRDAVHWGYGGGYGGGFHVADVLSFIIPPNGSSSVPSHQRCGESAYPISLGFPLSTAMVQGGQYEGFAYMGTIPAIMMLILGVLGVIRFIRRLAAAGGGQVTFCGIGNLIPRRSFPVSVILGMAALALLVLSWGYILHIAGHRLNSIPTPSLLLAFTFPKLMFARSLGRLAIPFTIWLIIMTVIWFDGSLMSWLSRKGFTGKAVISLLAAILIFAHIYEVRGYLKASDTVKGNMVRNVFQPQDQNLMHHALQGKTAILLVPALTDNFKWNLIGYSLAFHSGIPISGATVIFGEKSQEKKQYKADIETILNGGIGSLRARYGHIAIAAPSNIAKKIIQSSDLNLREYALSSQDIVLLIPEP